MAKVTAKTKDGFLVEMTEYEINCLAGYYRYDGQKIDIGHLFHPSEMYAQMERLLASKDQLTKHATKIRELGDALDSILLPDVVFEPKRAGKK